MGESPVVRIHPPGTDIALPRCLAVPRFDAFERHGVVGPGRAESVAAEPSVSARCVEIIAPNFFVMPNMQATFVVDVAGKKEKER
jgi:hypothetical protein